MLQVAGLGLGEIILTPFSAFIRDNFRNSRLAPFLRFLHHQSSILKLAYIVYQALTFGNCVSLFSPERRWEVGMPRCGVPRAVQRAEWSPCAVPPCSGSPF